MDKKRRGERGRVRVERGRGKEEEGGKKREGRDIMKKI